MFDKLLVQKIFESPYELEWSVQGLGMLRLYLSKEVRLHVWDSSLKSEDVSVIHTHPWDFSSYVVAGQINNSILAEKDSIYSVSHKKQKLHCGVGGGLVGEPENVQLEISSKNTFYEGQSYDEKAEEIHLSQALNGTVTIVERRFKDDEDHAFVYWEEGEWGSAEPRKATSLEITRVLSNSLERWFK
jgi:hypothetical protein